MSSINLIGQRIFLYLDGNERQGVFHGGVSMLGHTSSNSYGCNSSLHLDDEGKFLAIAFLLMSSLFLTIQ